MKFLAESLTKLIKELWSSSIAPTQYRRNTDVIPIAQSARFQWLGPKLHAIPVKQRSPHKHPLNRGQI